MRLESAKQIGLSGPLLAFRFGLSPRREFALLRREMGTRFQLVIFAGIAVEVQDFLFRFADFRHDNYSLAPIGHEPTEIYVVFVTFTGVRVLLFANPQ